MKHEDQQLARVSIANSSIALTGSLHQGLGRLAGVAGNDCRRYLGLKSDAKSDAPTPSIPPAAAPPDRPSPAPEPVTVLTQALALPALAQSASPPSPPWPSGTPAMPPAAVTAPLPAAEPGVWGEGSFAAVLK